MRLIKQAIFCAITTSLFLMACNSEPTTAINSIQSVKGLYCFGPSVNTFSLCEDGKEFWVADSVKQLELAYSNLEFEKPYEAVYVELEGKVIKSVDSLAINSDYDSTFVVTKLIKISKDIPDGPCAQ